MKAEGAPPPLAGLRERKNAILEAWLARTLQAYPEHTSRFLGRDRDPFRNPVGHTLREAFPVLLDAVLGGADSVRLTAGLDRIVRIRAVQDFTAGQAVAFVFLLKPVLREALHFPLHPPISHLGGEDTQGVPGEGANPRDALAILESRIDELALLAFDLFMRCRERIYEIKANEARRRVSVLLKRQGVEGRNGETENGGSGEGGAQFLQSAAARCSDSPIQDWKIP